MGVALLAIAQNSLSEKWWELSDRILSLYIHVKMVHAPKQAVTEKGMQIYFLLYKNVLALLFECFSMMSCQ
jgi:hypothetical protein